MCDVEEVIERLPKDLRTFAIRLKSQNVSEIARKTAVSRTTLNESVKRLRRRFERAGLKDYSTRTAFTCQGRIQ
jgi:DNA-binding NtrC family response regulator